MAQSARNDSSVEALLMLIYLPRLEQTVVYLSREAFPDFSMTGGSSTQDPLDTGKNVSENGSMVVYPAQVLHGVEARRFATGGLPLYCEYCNLTWRARSSSNENPPGQRAPWDEECPHHDFSGLQPDATQRQLVVFIDGACPGNGSQNATAGVGVYLGRNSTYNISEPVISLDTTPLTNQKAELTLPSVVSK
ncbi:hypothetical protein D6D01_06704 [Aureobasidium pullulans]|uniref:RNase H type-1 domain-containing protein n=1 Tax=Aureobasidium pullulans TaxID=5580 RepID=A0A4S9KVM0_AURPU|nr:hypothetical protein D6D01_06704 [Aureobasidium pullulans]